MGQGFLAGLMVKNLPAVQEMQVRSLGQEDPLEEETATHSSVLAWKIPWKEKPGGLEGCRVGFGRATEHARNHLALTSVSQMKHIQCVCDILLVLSPLKHI